MKRLLACLLALLCVLTACAKDAAFARDADGQGFTDTKNKIHYRALASAYEPATAGAEYGTYLDEAYDFSITFYEIPDLDPKQYLTDNYKTVYVAGDTLPNAAEWEISAVLICDYDAISVEVFRLTPAQDAAYIAELRALWFEGDGNAVSPMTGLKSTRRIQLTCAEYPWLFYCFTFSVYENGEAYFSDTQAGRTVQLTPSLAQRLQAY